MRSASRAGVPCPFEHRRCKYAGVQDAPASRGRCLASFAASTYRSWRAAHDQPVSALAVMLPRRDQTGLMCSNQCFAIRCGRIDGAPELVEPRVRSVLLRRSPSRGGLGRVRPGSSTGRFDRVRVEVGAVDHIVLVYYCGHTGQRSLLGGPPSRVSPCVLPGSVKAPWARREHPAPQSAWPSGDGAGGVAIIGAAVLIVARRRIRPHDRTAASGVRPRKGLVLGRPWRGPGRGVSGGHEAPCGGRKVRY